MSSAAHRRHAAERNAKRRGEDQGCRQQLDRARQMDGKRVPDRLLALQIGTEVALQHASQILDDLHRHRLIEPELFTKRGFDRRRRPRPQHRAGRVARRGLDQNVEGGDREDQDQGPEAGTSQDEGKHGGSSPLPGEKAQIRAKVAGAPRTGARQDYKSRGSVGLLEGVEDRTTVRQNPPGSSPCGGSPT